MWGPGIVGHGCSDNSVLKPGVYRAGNWCLHIRRLADVDAAALERPIRESVGYMREHYETR